MYFTAKTFTPILNTQYFTSVFGGEDGKSLPLDTQGLIRGIETIAFPNTKFKVERACSNHILEITTKDYPYKGPLFVDSRFLSPADETTPERTPKLPSSCFILKTLFSTLKEPYCWGGNCFNVQEMLVLYPPKEALPPDLCFKWQLKGFDCSGLIYYATDGFTPRNTSSWLNFGTSIPIEGKNSQEIIKCLKPLDAIVWKGHIIFIYDEKQVIESKGGEGVILTKIEERLESLLLNEKKKAKNNYCNDLEEYFLIRRWHPEFI